MINPPAYLLAIQKDEGIEAEGVSRGSNNFSFFFWNINPFQVKKGAEKGDEGGQRDADQLPDFFGFAFRRQPAPPQMEEFPPQFPLDLQTDVFMVERKRREQIFAVNQP